MGPKEGFRCPHCAKKIDVPQGPPADSAGCGIPIQPFAGPLPTRRRFLPRRAGRWLGPWPPPPPVEPDEYIEPRAGETGETTSHSRAAATAHVDTVTMTMTTTTTCPRQPAR